MTATLEDIHRDPAILDRAIARKEQLDILDDGEIAATLLPKSAHTMEKACQVMRERFASADWEFAFDAPMNRDERNSRG